ncbi:molybdopterin-dependent oxidoreductase [Bradyrhizobium cenepequi]|uniref:molybdopterin-dependent oxidoreductase n=1 Tax=Bradyrhizobium cenepequi TaxID=2821403 RepID=UPI001CE3AF9E|nr:molybdopterin-dependent oxidoreductase [Bradyrhizobium cenepequi]MCA6111087.1 molybdopterin-dependent oxidoreductase [Bradyrhizobium cenepequi]
MANPSTVFKAMAGKGPYPVKSLFSLGNNTLMSYANMPLILKSLLNQDLNVIHEQFMTPTAQLADYVLPADSWLEKPWIMEGYGWSSVYRPSQKAMEPPGECKSTFEFWKRTADALGRSDVVPWPTLEALYDWRLEKVGMGFEEFAETYEVYAYRPGFKKYERLLRDAERKGRAEVVGSREPGLRSAPLLSARSAGGPRIYAEDVHRRARGRILPNRRSPHSRAA